MATPESESFVRTFARGLAVIEAMGQGAHRQTIGEIADAVDLPRTAVRRFLMTLIDLSFVATDGKHYWLTPRVLRLGLSYLKSLPYWREAQTTLEELCTRVKQSCALSVLDDTELVYIVRQHSKRILAMSPTLGSRLPAHVVSMGRVLLSGLSNEELEAYLERAVLQKFTSATLVDKDALRERILQAQTQGYAWVDGELDDSICGLAVPVRDSQGTIIAAVNISLPAGQISEEDARQQYLAELRRAASQLRAAS